MQVPTLEEAQKMIIAAAREDDRVYRIEQLEKAFAALIDAVEAKDQEAIDRAMFIGRGLLF